MIILEANFKWHLEAFASELFIHCFMVFINVRTLCIYIVLIKCVWAYYKY